MPDSDLRTRIAVVDDVPSDTPLLTAHLLSAGYEVLALESGAETLDVSVDPQLDMILVTKPEACKRLREHPSARDVPVILITDAEAVDARVDGREAGADEFLSRPFRRAELLLRVRSLLRIRALEQQLQRSGAVIRSLETALRQHIESQARPDASLGPDPR